MQSEGVLLPLQPTVSLASDLEPVYQVSYLFDRSYRHKLNSSLENSRSQASLAFSSTSAFRSRLRVELDLPRVVGGCYGLIILKEEVMLRRCEEQTVFVSAFSFSL